MIFFFRNLALNKRNPMKPFKEPQQNDTHRNPYTKISGNNEALFQFTF